MRFDHALIAVRDLAAAKDHKGNVAEFLSRRGEVPYQIQLTTNRAHNIGIIELHGARIELVGL